MVCRYDCIIFPGLDGINTLNDEPFTFERYKIILRFFKEAQIEITKGNLFDKCVAIDFQTLKLEWEVSEFLKMLVRISGYRSKFLLVVCPTQVKKGLCERKSVLFNLQGVTPLVLG